jgi:hypothetical protein
MLVSQNSLFSGDVDVQTRMAVLVYAVYRATNAVRQKFGRTGQQHANDPGDSVSSRAQPSDSSSDDSSSGSWGDSSSDDSSADDGVAYCPCDTRISMTRQEAHELFWQYVYEGVGQHAAATKVIDNCWIAAARGNPRRRLV